MISRHSEPRIFLGRSRFSMANRYLADVEKSRKTYIKTVTSYPQRLTKKGTTMQCEERIQTLREDPRKFYVAKAKL